MNPEKPTEQNPSEQPLSDGGASLAAQFAQRPWTAMLHKFYGGALTAVALISLGGLGLAYMPAGTAPQAQQAAAAESQVIPEPAPFDGIEIGGKAGYVYDITTGKELYAKGAGVQLPLASLTKVMLVLAVSEVLEPTDIVPITYKAIEKSQGVDLILGEEWLMRDLVDFTLITSSNAGAEALAEAADVKLRAKYPEAPVGGAAAWRMNAMARQMGLEETYFINASGLDESPTQAGALGSARDTALLFMYAIQTEPQLFSGTTRVNVALAPLNFPGRIATNTNNALADIPGILMGKTGTTDLAGGNLAVAFKTTSGHTVAVVVLGATPEGRYDDVKKLVEATQKAVQ